MRTFLTNHLKQNVSSGDKPFNRRYNIAYKVVDSRVFTLPHTGSSGFAWLPFMVAGILAAGGTVIIATAKRRKKEEETLA